MYERLRGFTRHHRLPLTAERCHAAPSSIWQIGRFVAVVMVLLACESPPTVSSDLADRRVSLSASDTGFGAIDDTPDSTKYWIVLKPGNGRAIELAKQVLPRVGGTLRRTFDTAPVAFTVGGLSDSAVAWIKRLPQVDRIERLRRSGPDDVQQLPADNSMFHLDQIDQRGGALDNLFYYFFTGVGVHVYLVDTGVRGDH